MADINSLVGKLREEAKKERECFSGAKERQFFIELFDAESLDKLLDEFDPATHNSNWEAAYQQSPKKLNDVIKERRAIAFMYAGKMCAKRHYGDSEIKCHFDGVVRMNWNLNQLTQTERMYNMEWVK